MSAKVTLDPMIKEEPRSPMDIVVKFNSRDWKYFYYNPFSNQPSEEEIHDLQQSHEEGIRRVFQNHFTDVEIAQLAEIYQTKLYDRFDTIRITVLHTLPGSEINVLYDIETMRQIAFNALNLNIERINAWYVYTQEQSLKTVQKINTLTRCIINQPSLCEELLIIFQTIILNEFNSEEIDQLCQIRSSPILQRSFDLLIDEVPVSRHLVNKATRPFCIKLLAYALRNLPVEIERDTFKKLASDKLKEIILHYHDKPFDLPEPTEEELKSILKLV